VKPLLLLLASVVFARAETNALLAMFPPWSATVTIAVKAPESVKDQFESYLRRELRGLHDVTVTNRDGKYELDVVVLGLKGDDPSFGYAWSAILTQPLSSDYFVTLVKIYGGTNFLDQALAEAPPVSAICDHAIMTTPSDKIKASVEGYVAGIDNKCFQPERDSRNKTRADIEKAVRIDTAGATSSKTNAPDKPRP